MSLVVSDDIVVFHLLAFLLCYFSAKVLAGVLDKPYPWQNVWGFRQNVQNAYDSDHLSEEMKWHLRAYWSLSKAVKLVMVFAALQALLLTHTLTDKCRWSTIALQLAAHYRSVEPEARPKIDPYIDFFSFMAIMVYFLFTNGAAMYTTYIMRKDFLRDQLDEELGRMPNYPIMPFVLFWLVFTYKLIFFCSYCEDDFMIFFGVDGVNDVNEVKDVGEVST